MSEQKSTSKSRLSLLLFLTLIAVAPVFAKAPQYSARLCSSCAFGSQKDYCVQCGKWEP